MAGAVLPAGAVGVVGSFGVVGGVDLAAVPVRESGEGEAAGERVGVVGVLAGDTLGVRTGAGGLRVLLAAVDGLTGLKGGLVATTGRVTDPRGLVGETGGFTTKPLEAETVGLVAEVVEGAAAVAVVEVEMGSLPTGGFAAAAAVAVAVAVVVVVEDPTFLGEVLAASGEAGLSVEEEVEEGLEGVLLKVKELAG